MLRVSDRVLERRHRCSPCSSAPTPLQSLIIGGRGHLGGGAPHPLHHGAGAAPIPFQASAGGVPGAAGGSTSPYRSRSNKAAVRVRRASVSVTNDSDIISSAYYAYDGGGAQPAAVTGSGGGGGGPEALALVRDAHLSPHAQSIARRHARADSYLSETRAASVARRGGGFEAGGDAADVSAPAPAAPAQPTAADALCFAQHALPPPPTPYPHRAHPHTFV